MNGLELYEKLTARNYCLPVVFVTGHGDVPMAVATIKKGRWILSRNPLTIRNWWILSSAVWHSITYAATVPIIRCHQRKPNAAHTA